MTPNRLFHFTCDHGHAAIGTKGFLRPMGKHPFLGCSVVWLTSEPWPDRETTGLGMNITRCDRMRFRYVIPAIPPCRPWLDSPERAAAPGDALRSLETLGDPEHWWITSEPVKARLG